MSRAVTLWTVFEVTVKSKYLLWRPHGLLCQTPKEIYHQRGITDRRRVAEGLPSSSSKHSGPYLVQVSGNNGRDLANGVDTDDVVSADQLGFYSHSKNLR